VRKKSTEDNQAQGPSKTDHQIGKGRGGLVVKTKKPGCTQRGCVNAIGPVEDLVEEGEFEWVFRGLLPIVFLLLLQASI
jgi:hypothetical protein